MSIATTSHSAALWRAPAGGYGSLSRYRPSNNALEGFRYADDNQDVFRILAAEQIVSRQLLEPLLSMARFRNLVVHDYAKIDDEIVYGILKKRLGDFDAYAETIRIYLTGD